MLSYTDKAGREVLVTLEFIPRRQVAALMSTARYPARLAEDLQAMQAEEAGWNAAATGEQRAIDVGDFARRMFDRAGITIPIWGRVWFREELAASEQAAGAPARDIADLLASFDEGMRRGWRYGRWHSPLSPEGETGWHHVAVLEPVTRQAYVTAKRAGWRAT